METKFWEAVRQRAHALWLEEGCPEGKSDQHWQQAQRDMLASVPAVSASADQPEQVTSCEAPTCAPEENEAQTDAVTPVCAAPAPTELAPAVVQPLAKGMSLFKIKARQCRYIVSETYTPTIFCGAPTDGGSWCHEHNARVFARSAAKPAPKVERQLSAR